nr:serine hydrolase [uncultured Blautia sp.]
MTTGKPRRTVNNRAARLKKMRRRRIRHTILLVLLLIAVIGGGVFAVYTLRGGSLSAPVLPFKASSEFSSSVTARDSLKGDGFAKDLVVSAQDTPLDGVELEADQKGLLFDLTNNKVLFAKGAYERVYPASITKIMTAMLALKYGNMDETVTITQENVTLEDGSQVCGFGAGDKVTMGQLVRCLLVYSGNDAASAIAEHIGGTTENFVDMMNSYAAQLGCTGTHFSNPHGLQDENHYTTPYDIYLMLKGALNYPSFTEITQLPSYTVEYTKADGSTMSTVLEATDHYLTGEVATPKDVKILGGKTGTTSLAGNCLALLCQNAYGQPYIAIIMGASSKELLYQEMTSLLQHIN